MSSARVCALRESGSAEEQRFASIQPTKQKRAKFEIRLDFRPNIHITAKPLHKGHMHSVGYVRVLLILGNLVAGRPPLELVQKPCHKHLDSIGSATRTHVIVIALGIIACIRQTGAVRVRPTIAVEEGGVRYRACAVFVAKQQLFVRSWSERKRQAKWC